jgi:hypothetical protein
MKLGTGWFVFQSPDRVKSELSESGHLKVCFCRQSGPQSTSPTLPVCANRQHSTLTEP